MGQAGHESRWGCGPQACRLPGWSAYHSVEVASELEVCFKSAEEEEAAQEAAEDVSSRGRRHAEIDFQPDPPPFAGRLSSGHMNA